MPRLATLSVQAIDRAGSLDWIIGEIEAYPGGEPRTTFRAQGRGDETRLRSPAALRLPAER